MRLSIPMSTKSHMPRSLPIGLRNTSSARQRLAYIHSLRTTPRFLSSRISTGKDGRSWCASFSLHAQTTIFRLPQNGHAQEMEHMYGASLSNQFRQPKADGCSFRSCRKPDALTRSKRTSHLIACSRIRIIYPVRDLAILLRSRSKENQDGTGTQYSSTLLITSKSSLINGNFCVICRKQA